MSFNISHETVSRPAFNSQGSLFVFVTLLLLLLLIGCGATVPIQTPVTVSPTAIDFGAVTSNSQPVTVAVILANPAPTAIRIDSVSVIPASIFSVEGWAGPFILRAGQAIRLPVTFAPTSSGAYVGTLTVGTSMVRLASLTNGQLALSSTAWPSESTPFLKDPHFSTTVALQGRGTVSSKPDTEVSILPVSVNMQSGQSQQFTAAVSGKSSSGIKWTTRLGTITSTGLYTAPIVSKTMQDTVTASLSNPYRVATAVVTIAPLPSSQTSMTVSVSPASVTLAPNQVQQFVATVSGGSSRVEWTATLGSVDTSGLYTAPQVPSGTVVTVSAISLTDPSKYDTASVYIVADPPSSSGPYSLTKQQPVSFQAYAGNANSITSKPLPSDVMSHLYTSPQGASGNVIAVCTLTDCGNSQYSPGGSLYSLWGYSAPGNSDQSAPVYYATATDPWYKLTGCSVSSMNGTAFHAPNAAKLSSAKTSDNNIYIWDQTTGIMWNFYTYSNPTAALPTSTCSGTGSSSCAVTFNHFSNSYCAGEQFTRESDWGYAGIAAPLGGGDSLMPGAQFSAFGGIVRRQELQQGQINHAIKMTDDCHNPNNKLVFPGTSTDDPGLQCGSVSYAGSDVPQRPPGGALLFLDYTPSQLTTICAAVPGWACTYITAMSKYGMYVGVTGGTGGYVPFGSNSFESGQAWKYYGLSDPFDAWIKNQPGITCGTHSDGSMGCSGKIFNNVPLLQCTASSGCQATDTSGRSCTSGPGCDPTGHIHMADPCVVKRLAGQPGAC